MKKIIEINLIEGTNNFNLNISVNFDNLEEDGLKGQVVMELEKIKQEIIKRYENSGVNITY